MRLFDLHFLDFKSIFKQTKNRKPKPAVKEHFRKVFLSFYFLKLFSRNQAIRLNFKFWLICQCSVCLEVVPACLIS